MFTSKSSYILKKYPNPPEKIYEYETEGLNKLRITEFLTIPEVIYYNDNCIILEDLGSGNIPNENYWRNLGLGIAEIHQRANSQFGYEFNNYNGMRLMENSWNANLYEFYNNQRYSPLLSSQNIIAALIPETLVDLRFILEKLPVLIPDSKPVLVHGDLWHGNILVDKNGDPAIIDPAVYFGHPWFDVYNLRMWGKIDSEVFDSIKSF